MKDSNNDDNIFCILLVSEWFANQQKFTIPIEQQSKEELNKCIQVFYAFIRQKDVSDIDIDIDIDRYRDRDRDRDR